MRLVIDTDVFCKLGVAGILQDAVRALGLSESDCGRLHALPYMLAKGRLPERYGITACAALIPVAKTMPAIPSPDIEWTDRLAPIPEIGPGEVQLLALAAQRSLFVLSGDKRALRALTSDAAIVCALSGRIVVLEALLLFLCRQWGTTTLRNKLLPVLDKDRMLSICFSTGCKTIEGLTSYYNALSREVNPLGLWDPEKGAMP